jgi:hypothetical protein
MSWRAQNRSKDAKKLPVVRAAGRKNLNWIVARSSHRVVRGPCPHCSFCCAASALFFNGFQTSRGGFEASSPKHTRPYVAPRYGGGGASRHVARHQRPLSGAACALCLPGDLRPATPWFRARHPLADVPPAAVHGHDSYVPQPPLQVQGQPLGRQRNPQLFVN